MPPTLPMLPMRSMLPDSDSSSGSTQGNGLSGTFSGTGGDLGNMFENFLALFFMSPGATGMGLPLIPGMPMLSGLPGMAVRRMDAHYGPHWDAQVQARSTAAGESLINPLQLLPQNSEHPSYPPGMPLRF